MDKCAVSIIIPVYNVEKFLRECLDSAINQTLKDKEVIIINDGSKDNSLEIAESYKRKYSFVKLINQENKGLSEARNAGLQIATGEYVLFLDSDDYLDLSAADVLYNKCKELDLDILKFNWNTFSDSTPEEFVENKAPKSMLSTEVMSGADFLDKAIKSQWYIVCAPFQMIRRKYLQDCKIRFIPDITFEDNVFNIQILLASKAVRILQIKDILCNIRLRSGSITDNYDYNNFNSMFKAILIMNKFVSDHNLSKKDKVNSYKVISALLFHASSLFCRLDEDSKGKGIKLIKSNRMEVFKYIVYSYNEYMRLKNIIFVFFPSALIFLNNRKKNRVNGKIVF